MDVTKEKAAAVETAVGGESGNREATDFAVAPEAASDKFACPMTGYDPMAPINLQIRSEHNTMPNSCKANIEFDPTYVFHLPVTRVPNQWFKDDQERIRFFSISTRPRSIPFIGLS